MDFNGFYPLIICTHPSARPPPISPRLPSPAPPGPETGWCAGRSRPAWCSGRWRSSPSARRQTVSDTPRSPTGSSSRRWRLRSVLFDVLSCLFALPRLFIAMFFFSSLSLLFYHFFFSTLFCLCNVYMRNHFFIVIINHLFLLFF